MFSLSCCLPHTILSKHPSIKAMFLIWCQAEFLREPSAKACALRMMRFDAWHLMKESQRKGEKKTGWQTDTQMLKEKKNPMENKELKLLNVGGRFGLGAFFFFFFSFSTISSWPQVSTPHSLWGVFFPPQPLIGYLNRSRSTLVFSSLSAVHQKKKKKLVAEGGGLIPARGATKPLQPQTLPRSFPVVWKSARSEQTGSATGIIMASSAYVQTKNPESCFSHNNSGFKI